MSPALPGSILTTGQPGKFYNIIFKSNIIGHSIETLLFISNTHLIITCVSFSVMAESLQPHGLSTEFSRQEYQSGLPFLSSGDLPTTVC